MGEGEPRVLVLPVLLPGPLWEQLCLELAGPAWVLGSSRRGPKLLSVYVQGDDPRSKFFGGK